MKSALVLALVGTQSSSAAVLGGKAFLGNGMQPEVVARTLSNVEDEWKAQAAVFAECNSTSALPGSSIVNCADAPSSFGKSCSTVVGAIIQGSGGDRDVAKEYMADVCSQRSISGWHQQQCNALAVAVRGSMSADKYENRENFNSVKLCTGFWSHFLGDEQTRLAKEKVDHDAAEKLAAEETEAAEKAAAEQRKKQAAEEAERKKTEEATRKKQEAEAQAAEAKEKAAEAAAKAAQKKLEAEESAKAAKLKKAEADAAEKEQKKAVSEAKVAPVATKEAPKPAAAVKAAPVVVTKAAAKPVAKAPEPVVAKPAVVVAVAKETLKQVAPTAAKPAETKTVATPAKAAATAPKAF